jgi:hypothetical protein
VATKVPTGGRPKRVRTEAEKKALHERQKADRRNRRAAQAEKAARELAAEVQADRMHEVLVGDGKMITEASSAKGRESRTRAKDAVWAAFEAAGGDDALAVFAVKYPKEFYTQIWAKMIPRVQEVEASENLEDLLMQLGGGKMPGMTEALPPPIEAEWQEIDMDKMGEAA